MYGFGIRIAKLTILILKSLKFGGFITLIIEMILANIYSFYVWDYRATFFKILNFPSGGTLIYTNFCGKYTA